jgi:hypothetical protein
MYIRVTKRLMLGLETFLVSVNMGARGVENGRASLDHP